MGHASPGKLIVGAAMVAAAAMSGWNVSAQNVVLPVNDGVGNPYQTIEGFFKMPESRTWGSTSAVEIDKDGKTIWVAERCGTNSCAATPTLDTVFHFDQNGKLLHSFGAGMMIFPHGIHVDRDGNIWVTDGNDNSAALTAAARGAAPGGGGGGRGAGGAAPAAGAAPGGGAGGGRGGGAPGAAGGAQAPGGAGRGPAATGPNPAATIGHQVIKFSPKGDVIMRIGRAGGATGPTVCCWQPNDVVTNAAGEIFIAEGHGGNPNDRIMKFSKDGKFIQAWGKRGAGPGEFNQPHALAFDSQGRLFVGDRANNRTLIFDRNMNQVADWPQFSRPSGLFIDRNDILYSADSESGSVNPAHGAWKRGIRMGSVKDGKVTGFIPDPSSVGVGFVLVDGKAILTTLDGKPGPGGTLAAEGVAVDNAGNIYGAEVGPRKLQKYVKMK